MNIYLQRLPNQGNEFQIMKTRFGEIMDGLLRGGSYAFDRKAYTTFYPLAISSGFGLKEAPDFFKGNDKSFIRLEMT
jgi:hypothetical protein